MAEIILDDDEMMDSTAMAEAMGFSGFGMQNPPSKKRKFNPNADAAISAPAKNKPAASTGANTAPLGQRMRLPPPSSDLPARPSAGGLIAGKKTDTDEIDLDDGGDEAEVDSHESKNPAAGDNGNEDDRYIDTSHPSRGYFPEEVAEMEAQDKIDVILAQQGSIPDLPARPPHGDGNFQHHHGQQRNQRGGGRGGGRGHHHRQDDPDAAPWWEGYYDPKMNQNPWEDLEKRMGLQPRGTWILKDAKLTTMTPAVTQGQDQTVTSIDEKNVAPDNPDKDL